MTNEIQIFQYEGQDIEFDVSNPKLIVNATEMANVFGKKVNDFLRLDQTKAFIQECLSYGISRNSDGENGENSHFLGIESEVDLVRVNYRHGTWMHRILALKFAAWLNPRFELWVYLTIDQILRGQGPVKPEDSAERREALTVIAQANARIVEARERIRKSHAPDDLIIEENERLIAQTQKKISKMDKGVINQLNLFALKDENPPAGKKTTPTITEEPK